MMRNLKRCKAVNIAVPLGHSKQGAQSNTTILTIFHMAAYAASAVHTGKGRGHVDLDRGAGFLLAFGFPGAHDSGFEKRLDNGR